MSGKPASRVGDLHLCAKFNGVVPHLGGPIKPPGAVTVLIGGKVAARMTDQAECIGPDDDVIAKGAFPVPICNRPAARETDPMAHGTKIPVGSGCQTVLIGLAGETGNVYAGNKVCQAMAAGRPGKTAGQNYGNCGLESARQLLRQAGTVIRERALVWQAVNKGWALVGSPSTPGGVQPVLNNPATWNGSTGGSWTNTQRDLLGHYGLPSTMGGATDPNLIPLALSRGQGVVASVDVGVMWPVSTAGLGVPPGPQAPAMGSWHAVNVTGVRYDDNGNITHYVINDTGTGQCSVAVPKATFESSLAAFHTPTANVVTTNAKIW